MKIKVLFLTLLCAMLVYEAFGKAKSKKKKSKVKMPAMPGMFLPDISGPIKMLKKQQREEKRQMKKRQKTLKKEAKQRELKRKKEAKLQKNLQMESPDIPSHQSAKNTNPINIKQNIVQSNDKQYNLPQSHEAMNMPCNHVCPACSNYLRPLCVDQSRVTCRWPY